ncbi:MAG: hypothetical protein J2P15_09055 [Micromonosporaceae bacterium]|nr:hypothetical protein [Micromonosporaceae bacterium]
MARTSTGSWCSFCGTPEHQVEKIIAGPGVYICDACVELCSEILAEVRGTPSGAPSRPRQIADAAAMSDDELLERLPRCARTGAEAEASLRRLVLQARGRGITWARIGSALGMTRQSAWERFSGEE